MSASAAVGGHAGEVSISRDVLRTLITSLEAFWSDHDFARGTPAYERDAAAIAEARTALRGRPARAAVVPHQGPRPPKSAAARPAAASTSPRPAAGKKKAKAAKAGG